MKKKYSIIEMVTTSEAAELLQVSERTVRRLLRDGKIKGALVARRWWVIEDSIDQFIRSGGER